MVNSSPSSLIRIGSRGSELAKIQTKRAAELFEAAHPQFKTDIKIIKTDGDWRPSDGEVPLNDKEGGKGQFIKTIEDHILDGRVDFGVHSLKDVPSFLHDDLCVQHFLSADAPNDCFISNNYNTPDEMPDNSVIGTTSPRRQAIIKQKWPHLKTQTLRGNVPTRIEKMQNGDVDAIILGNAGVERLGLTNHIRMIFDTDDFIPACGQGVIAIECRTDNDGLMNKLDAITCAKTTFRVLAERAFLQCLNGSCHTPVGVYVDVSDDQAHISLTYFVGSVSGDWHYTKVTDRDTEDACSNESAIEFGHACAQTLLKTMSASQKDEIGLNA